MNIIATGYTISVESTEDRIYYHTFILQYSDVCDPQPSSFITLSRQSDPAPVI
jgi:hypothetical protein